MRSEQDSKDEEQAPSGACYALDPDVLQLNALNPEFNADPYSMLAKVREHEVPIRSDAGGYVVVTRAKEVGSILRDPDLWIDPRKANPGTPSSMLVPPEGEEPSMLLSDDPRHKRLRGLASQAFTPRAIERWRERTAELARSLLETTGQEYDLIEDFAGPLPTVVIAEILGVDSAQRDWFKRCSDATVYAFFNPNCTPEEKEAGQQAAEDLITYFGEQVAARRQKPNDDLISFMVQAEPSGGERFSDNEIARQCNLLIVAGNVTTTDLIGNGVHALLTHRDQWDLLCADQSLLPQAVEELLRYCAPVTNSGRIASKDAQIAGCPIHRGESYSLSLAAANRDPAICEDAEKLDIRRQRVRHFSFGGGKHFCLGAHLARMEAQEAFRALTQAQPDLQLVDGAAELRAMPSFRGYVRLGVRQS